jgi:hypothetical protein
VGEADDTVGHPEGAEPVTLTVTCWLCNPLFRLASSNDVPGQAALYSPGLGEGDGAGWSTDGFELLQNVVLASVTSCVVPSLYKATASKATTSPTATEVAVKEGHGVGEADELAAGQIETEVMPGPGGPGVGVGAAQLTSGTNSKGLRLCPQAPPTPKSPLPQL